MAAAVGSHFSMLGITVAKMTCSMNRAQVIATTMAPIVLLMKLQARDRTQLVVIAYETGLVTPSTLLISERA